MLSSYRSLFCLVWPLSMLKLESQLAMLAMVTLLATLVSQLPTTPPLLLFLQEFTVEFMELLTTPL